MNGLYRAAVVTVLAAILFSSSTRRLGVESRGIMVEPPHRSSLWRYNYNVSVNLRDDGLNCGGYDWQWGVHKGRCGVCGDRYNGTQDNADKGKWDRGIIVRQYRDGHYINITFEVSNNYLGYVEFRLCPRNSTRMGLNQSCFDRYPLWIDESHGTRYYIGSRGGIYDIHIRLPSGLVCRRCVLQWKYKTGYRYNGDDQFKCLGCGRQEQYVNCADIEITPLEGWPISPGSNLTDRRTTIRPIDRRATIQPILRHADVRRTDRWRDTRRTPSWRGRIPAVIRDTTTLPMQKTTLNNIGQPQTHISKAGQLYSASTQQTPPAETGLQLENPIQVDTTKSSNMTSTRSPSFKSPELTSQIIPIPSMKSGSDVNITTRTPRKALPLDDIRRELIKILSNTTGGSGQKVKMFFSPTQDFFPIPTTSAPIPQATIHSIGITEMAPAVPNTQFVSVSNILERFYPKYPNFITPFLVSIATRRGTTLKLPAGCDVTSDEFRCVAVGIYNQSPGMSQWCEMHCRANNCLPNMCLCFCEDRRRTQNTSCHAIAEFNGVVGMDQWCSANCNVGYCPANTCSVEDCLPPSNGEP